VKIKTLHIFLFFALISQITAKCFAQSIDSVKLDSLILVLTLEKEDERTVNAYLELAKEYKKTSEYTIAMTYANLCRDMAIKINYDEAELESTLIIANLYLVYYLDFKNAQRYYDKALVLAESSGDNYDLLAVYKGYSFMYASVYQLEEALYFNEKSIELAEIEGDEQIISSLSSYGSGLYEELGDTAKAIELLEEVVRIEEENNFMNTSKASLTAIAHYYHLKGDLEKSLDQYRIALKRFQRLKDDRWVAYVHSEMARVYMDIDNLDRAEQHALKGYEIATARELNKEIGDNLFVLTELYSRKGDTAKVNEYSSLYEELMQSVHVELEPRLLDDTSKASTTSSASPINWYDGFLSAILISILIGLTVFISGLAYRKG
jgi:tetratricopeptide (TPR) repeat protein